MMWASLVFVVLMASTVAALETCNGRVEYCNILLKNFVFPGTHNSGAYHSTLNPVYERMKTQDASIYNQLLSGMRHFDFDYCRHDGSVRIGHATNLYCGGDTLNTVLDDIKSFLSANRQVVIVIALSDYDKDINVNDVRKATINGLHQYLVSSTVTMESSLRDVLSSGQILLLETGNASVSAIRIKKSYDKNPPFNPEWVNAVGCPDKRRTELIHNVRVGSSNFEVGHFNSIEYSFNTHQCDGTTNIVQLMVDAYNVANQHTRVFRARPNAITVNRGGRNDWAAVRAARFINDFNAMGGVDWTPRFSEEHGGYSTSMPGSAITGLRCHENYCDDMDLRIRNVRDCMADSGSWLASVSEEDGGVRNCPSNSVVVQLQCAGRYCDDTNLKCASLSPSCSLQSTSSYTRWTETSPHPAFCPEGYVMTGIECKGRYCKQKRLRCSRLYETQRTSTMFYIEGHHGVGHHAATFRQHSLALCLSRCDAWLGCLGVNYAPNGECYLKDSSSSSAGSANVPGLLFFQTFKDNFFVCGSGQHLRTATTSSFVACKQACDHTQGCKAVNFDEASGACYLKGSSSYVPGNCGVFGLKFAWKGSYTFVPDRCGDGPHLAYFQANEVACQLACDEDRACMAANFFSGQCSLKSTASSTAGDCGENGLRLYTKSNYMTLPGRCGIGPHLAYFQATSEAACQLACDEDRACMAANFYSGQCSLKSTASSTAGDCGENGLRFSFNFNN